MYFDEDAQVISFRGDDPLSERLADNFFSFKIRLIDVNGLESSYDQVV